jgi:hypothetical protein
MLSFIKNTIYKNSWTVYSSEINYDDIDYRYYIDLDKHNIPYKNIRHGYIFSIKDDYVFIIKCTCICHNHNMCVDHCVPCCKFAIDNKLYITNKPEVDPDIFIRHHGYSNVKNPFKSNTNTNICNEKKSFKNIIFDKFFSLKKLFSS